ncbi:MAG: ATP-dependent DNA helicase RecG [Lachnospira sp.]|nr:ATP-dependent DNA helicase RecG [Lachnospira sp.]
MDIKTIKGVGEKTASILGRLSIYTAEDLIHLYPRDYDVYEKPVLVKDITKEDEGRTVSIDGVIASGVQLYRAGHFSVVSVILRDMDGNGIKANWFNMPYLKAKLIRGQRFVFRGYLSAKNGQRVLEQPALWKPADYMEQVGVYHPKYPLTKGISNAQMTRLVKAALSMCDAELAEDPMPLWIRRRYQLAEYNFAVRSVHFPRSQEEFLQAHRRLIFEEFFLFILSVSRLKDSKGRRANTHVIAGSDWEEKLIASLPYELTAAQKRALREIEADMSGASLMNRLVQGDVGSGKTIVAAAALVNAAAAGFQAAIMAPTEVLARQEYNTIRGILSKAEIPVRTGLLTGSLTPKNKREAQEKISDGTTQIVCGTQALIQDKITFKNLGLVVTDEQHRFGVEQRKTLSGKGNDPHVLVMSATPIPRTLALILYGDLDISVIDELPAGRKRILNAVVSREDRPKIERFLIGKIQDGRQAYVICPMVEENPEIDAENVTDYSRELQKKLGSSVKVGMLNGRMKPDEKNSIMESFARGDIDVLVSTTVVEVGVNVPNATVMIVEDANRFGLAQLHQLRGRVGRGSEQSYCVFVTNDKSPAAMKRLSVLAHTDDGFKIAEEDLKLRGPGEFFGDRQSGEFAFAAGDIFADSDILKEAAQAAEEIRRQDPELERDENAPLKRKLSEFTQEQLSKIGL